MERSHTYSTSIVALGLLVMLALTHGCTGEANSTSTRFGAATYPVATAQAEMTLRELFRAWAAKDGTAVKALLTPRHQVTWRFESLDHVEFGTVLAAPDGIDSYMTYGRGSLDGMDRDDVRCFRASVTFYYKPGVVGSTESGEEMPWMWFLVKGADGEWRVDDWGF